MLQTFRVYNATNVRHFYQLQSSDAEGKGHSVCVIRDLQQKKKGNTH